MDWLLWFDHVLLLELLDFEVTADGTLKTNPINLKRIARGYERAHVDSKMSS